jgi:hypothetical protein
VFECRPIARVVVLRDENLLEKIMEIYAGKQQKCLRSEFSKGMIAVLNREKW